VLVRETEEEAWAAADALIDNIPPNFQQMMDKILMATDSEGEKRQQTMRKEKGDLLLGPNLWAGISQARLGVGTALVGSGENVARRFQEYVDAGIDTFILSGYPHLEEAERFGRYVMPHFRGSATVPVAPEAFAAAR
jgi:alkanesulfonate monooxygenase